MSEPTPFSLTEPAPATRGTKPNGYAQPPGTGPAGKTCRQCQHYAHQSGVAGSYPKCGLARASWTGGRGSDILARSPACRLFEDKAQ